MDDLYNNLKVYEPAFKGMSSSSSSTQNMDFLSSSNNNTNSTNGAVNTAQAVNTSHGVSTASIQVNASYSTNIDNLSDVVICSFFDSQPNSPQLVHKDLEQIHLDDMEDMDLRWQIAMLTMRARRAPRNQDNKHKESSRRSVPIKTSTTTTLVSCDHLGGYDWSDQEKEGPNYALMAFSSSSSDSKGNPQMNLQDQGVIDSGCSRHMTWNMSYFTDYEEIDGGYTQKPRKPKRKDTQVPQPSGPTNNVADEAVHKKFDNSLVRAVTSASSITLEQDNGNITKTQSKAIPNEPSSQGTNSGGGPRVLDLEKTETTQRNEIDSLKRRVKKLKKRNRSRTHKLKRLYKVGLSARVESSRDEESLGEDASKKGRRIDAIDADEDITLVNDADNKMFDVDELGGEEIFVARQNDNVVEEVVNVAQVSTAITTITITTKEITLAQALEALKTSKPNVKRIVFQEPAKIDADHQLAERLQAQEQEEFFDAEKATLFQQLLKKRRNHFAAKSAEEKRNKPPTKAQQRKIMCTYLKNMKGYKLKELKLKEFDSIQEMFDKAFKRVNTFEDFRTELVKGKEKKARTKLEQEITKKQKVEDDKEKAELKQLMETIPDEEEVAIDAIPLAVKSPRVVDQKIHKEGKKSYYLIVRVDGKSQMYMIFSQLLKSFDREDLKDLYKLVKSRYGSKRLVENIDYLLWSDMKIMFEPYVEDEVWKLQKGYKVLEWKLYDSRGVHSLMMQSMQIYMLVEKKYPLTPHTLSMMLKKKLQIDYESEMAYQLCKLIKK
nr:hypothetical protein [Tanacetum cinerariifolium]